jgi:hypothetical protein
MDITKGCILGFRQALHIPAAASLGVDLLEDRIARMIVSKQRRLPREKGDTSSRSAIAA